MRTPSPTVAGAVQELRRTSAPHLFPVSSTGRDRQADTLLLQLDLDLDLDPTAGIIAAALDAAGNPGAR